MIKTRRIFFLTFFAFLAVMLAAITAILSFAAYQSQSARFGDIFDRVVSEQTQSWVLPALIALVGVTLVGILLFIGFWKFRKRNAANHAADHSNAKFFSN